MLDNGHGWRLFCKDHWFPEALAEENRGRVMSSWNTGPVQQGSELMSRVIQERVQNLFDLDYDYQNWSWLYPSKSEVPLLIPRTTMLAREDAAVDPPVEEEAKIPSEDEFSRLEPRFRRRSNQEGRLKRRGASRSPRAPAREHVSRFCMLEFHQMLDSA